MNDLYQFLEFHVLFTQRGVCSVDSLDNEFGFDSETTRFMPCEPRPIKFEAIAGPLDFESEVLTQKAENYPKSTQRKKNLNPDIFEKLIQPNKF